MGTTKGGIQYVSQFAAPKVVRRHLATKETLLHMSTKLSSFQRLGMEPLKLLASAGGVAEASKCIFLLSGSPC
jgi:hypothetical protein